MVPRVVRKCRKKEINNRYHAERYNGNEATITRSFTILRIRWRDNKPLIEHSTGRLSILSKQFYKTVLNNCLWVSLFFSYLSGVPGDSITKWNIRFLWCTSRRIDRYIITIVVFQYSPGVVSHRKLSPRRWQYVTGEAVHKTRWFTSWSDGACVITKTSGTLSRTQKRDKIFLLQKVINFWSIFASDLCIEFTEDLSTGRIKSGFFIYRVTFLTRYTFQEIRDSSTTTRL